MYEGSHSSSDQNIVFQSHKYTCILSRICIYIDRLVCSTWIIYSFILILGIHGSFNANILSQSDQRESLSKSQAPPLPEITLKKGGMYLYVYIFVYVYV
jgi:hypothetical protein